MICGWVEAHILHGGAAMVPGGGMFARAPGDREKPGPLSAINGIGEVLLLRQRTRGGVTSTRTAL